jgi:CheY-like chemotaxis protein
MVGLTNANATVFVRASRAGRARPRVRGWHNEALAGRSILVVEDEPLIALDIVESLTSTGANPIVASILQHALELATSPNLAAAVLDYKIGDADTSPICELLKSRGIPFLFYSGYNIPRRIWPDVETLSKPATPDKLVTAVALLCANGAHA